MARVRTAMWGYEATLGRAGRKEITDPWELCRAKSTIPVSNRLSTLLCAKVINLQFMSLLF